MGNSRRNPDVPGTSRPGACKCGAPATTTLEQEIEIYGKPVKVKVRVCDEHKNLKWEVRADPRDMQ